MNILENTTINLNYFRGIELKKSISLGNFEMKLINMTNILGNMKNTF